MFVSRIFPEGTNPFLEEVVFGIVGQLTGTEDVVEHRPELLHLDKEKWTEQNQKPILNKQNTNWKPTHNTNQIETENYRLQ